jgi:hypothetical protein
MGELVFCCSHENDLYQAIGSSGKAPLRFDKLEDALQCASGGDGVLALADSYPIPNLRIDDKMLHRARQKGLRLYTEYPLSVPNVYFGEPRTADWERLVVASDFFKPELPQLSILTMHSCWFLPAKVRDYHLALARVAGYDTAVYGLSSEVHPILFNYSDSVIVATSKLSQFRTGRYAPSASWKSLWEELLRWLSRGDQFSVLWTPTVAVRFDKDEKLPDNVEKETFRGSAEWFHKHALFAVDRDVGVIEGYQSGIDYEGRQLPRPHIRMDCLAEAAMVFALDWEMSENPRSKSVARSLLDYTWSFQYSDPNAAAYGLVDWGKGLGVFYGDDNARVILPTLAAVQILGDDKWDEAVVRSILADFRTTGPSGFREDRIDMPDLNKNGWRHYYENDVVSLTPHYQAYLWACFIWLSSLTGNDDFLIRAENAIRMTMSAYPNWLLSNGLSQEMSRMLLPLAFLVRAKGKPAHREWLDRITKYVLAQQQPCGAIAERVGDPKNTHYPPPSSNDSYGTTEAPVIQQNGDPASDMLYTQNFAFLGLHEAAAATNDVKIREAEDKLADFLCRTQLRSQRHPYLNGCWMRSFDYKRWEYWGSSSDLGWGAWCVESGWMNTWIASVFAMRTLDRTLFSLSRANEFNSKFSKILPEMLPP